MFYKFYNEIEMFNLEEKKWRQPVPLQGKKINLKRKSHVAESYGKFIIVHGGINEEKEVVGETVIYNSAYHSAFYPEYAEDSLNPILAYHASCLVVPIIYRIQPKVNLHKFPDIGKKAKEKIKHKGVYIFGGQDPDGILNDEVFCFTIGTRESSWIKLETTGSKPCARINCSLNFYENGNFVIVFGGRNDAVEYRGALNDCFCLELNKLTWLRVETLNSLEQKPAFRNCHKAALVESQLVIFGGMDNKTFVGNDLAIFDLGSYVSNYRKMKKFVVQKVSQKKFMKSEYSLNS